MDDPAIGRREYGRFNQRSRHYHCDICDRVVRMDQTIIPDPPHPKAGLRVCLTSGGFQGCYDEPDYAMNVALRPPLPSTTENLP